MSALRRFTRDGALLAGGALASRLLQAAAYALLARMVPASDFGTLALAAIALNALALLPGLGLGTALVARGDDPRPAARSAVTAALLGGGAVALLALLIALVVRQKGDPAVAELIALLGVALLFQGPGVVAGALLDRERRFGARVAADLVGGLGYLLVAAIAAALGAGAKALALGLVAAAALQSLVALRAARLAPTLRLDRAALKAPARLGSLLLLTALLQWAFTSADLALIERRFGRDAVGCYATAMQLAMVPAGALGLLSGRLALPALVAARTRPDGGGRGFLQASGIAALLAAAACATMVLFARPLIDLLYGANFAGAVPLLPLLALSAFARVLGGLAGPALLACGGARVACTLVAAQLAVALPAGALVPAEFGAGGVALVFALVQVAACAIAFALGSARLALPGAAALRASVLPLIAALGPALLLAALARVVPLAPRATAALGGALGLLLLLLLGRVQWRALRGAAS
ncbi:MAG: oligosaccharide flippase family protein [Planctomycetes bacterium]|nr:oligosaccharide flippase family protein [Planctomycetota bacterium]